MFNNESDSALYCHFCMKRVCSIECVYDENFVIPRLFNVAYDLNPHQVCSKAGAFLSKQNFLRIHSMSPQVAIHEELKTFMIRRRQLNYVFDLIKCDAWVNIVERNGFAAEKNLILKDCYLTLQQLAELPSGLLMKKVRSLESVILQHILSLKIEMNRDNTKDGQHLNEPLNACKSCKISKHRCEVCNGKNGPQFYEFEITVGSKCTRCGTKAHNVCLRERHKCTYLQSGTKNDLSLLE